MTKPKHIVRAKCIVCDSTRAGAYYKSDKDFHHYLCEEEDANGGQHTFPIPIQDSKSKIKTLTNEGIKVGAALIIIKNGVEIINKRMKSNTKEEAEEIIREAAEILTENADKTIDAATSINTDTIEDVGGGIIKTIGKIFDFFT